MDQVDARDGDRAVLYLLQFRYREANRVVAVGGASGEDTFLGTLCLGWSDLSFPRVIVVEPNMEHKDDPYVPVLVQTIEATGIDLIH